MVQFKKIYIKTNKIERDSWIKDIINISKEIPFRQKIKENMINMQNMEKKNIFERKKPNFSFFLYQNLLRNLSILYKSH